MTSPQTPLDPRSLATLIDHYQKQLNDKKIPYEVRLDMCFSLYYYVQLYNQCPIGKPVSISSPVNLAA
jgi:hypothetical protein